MVYLQPPFRTSLALLVLILLLALISIPPAAAHPRRLPDSEPLPTDRLLVRLQAPMPGDTTTASLRPLLNHFTRTLGKSLHLVRTTASGELVLRLDQALPHDEVVALTTRLSRDPAVRFAVPDSLLQPMLEPDDPGYVTFGWPLQALAPGQYGISMPAAWAITTGSPEVVVAILDTGALLSHPELIGRNPSNNPGYDLLSDSLQAGDGDARDPNPSDEGDFITADEAAGSFAHCPVTNSSWHGTHVAGIIGARANNGQGSVGVAWEAALLHVRVLGKCGGYISDIADGIRWAVGETVFATTRNPNPAQVLNLSLGGLAPCNPVLQSAISSAVSQGAVVVVAAGNYNSEVSTTQPANCDGVIAVAATGRNGQRAPYSNAGSLISLAAPGGVRASDGGIYAPIDQGLQRPTGPSYAFYQGTSMAAPHVAGVVALMRSVNPGLHSSDIRRILEITATPFPPDSSCVGLCGAGILNAGSAVEEAARRVRTATFLSASSSQPVDTLITLPIRLNLAAATPLSLPFRVSRADQPDQILLNGNVEVAAASREALLSFALPLLEPSEAPLIVRVELEATGQVRRGALASHELTLTPPARPVLALNPSSLNFGDQRARTLSAAQTITITNQGEGELRLDAFTITGSFQRTAGSCPTDLPFTLAPTSSCTLALSFAPTSALLSRGSLIITSNAPGSPHQVELDGRGVTPALGFGPTSFAFAPQLVGTASPSQPITITNPGSAPLLIERLALSGPFVRNGGSCPATLPASLAAGTSCTTLVTFTPQEAGTGTGALRVTTDLPGVSYEVPLSGVGLAPALALDRSMLHFGSQASATTSVARRLLLSNSGDHPLTLTALELAEPAFAYAGGTCPAVPLQLNPGASCSLSLTFTPRASTSYSGTLLLYSDDPGGPHYLELVGIGTADPAPSAQLDPPMLRFAGPPGPNQPAQSVTIQNQGAATLTVSALTFDGEAFALDTTTCGAIPFMLDPDQTCTLSIALLANDPGVYSGTLHMTSDDGAGERSVALQATVLGKGPPPALVQLAPLSVTLEGSLVHVTLRLQREAGVGPATRNYRLTAERSQPDANLIVAAGTISLAPEAEEQTITISLDRLVLYEVIALSAELDPHTTPSDPPAQRALLPSEINQVYLPLVYVPS